MCEVPEPVGRLMGTGGRKTTNDQVFTREDIGVTGAVPVPGLPENRRCDMTLPYVNAVATGQNINRLRAAAGLSVKDLQVVFGFATPQAIYKWLHSTDLPTIDNLAALAFVLGVTMDEIVVVETRAQKCG